MIRFHAVLPVTSRNASKMYFSPHFLDNSFFWGGGRRWKNIINSIKTSVSKSQSQASIQRDIFVQPVTSYLFRHMTSLMCTFMWKFPSIFDIHENLISRFWKADLQWSEGNCERESYDLRGIWTTIHPKGNQATLQNFTCFRITTVLKKSLS